MTKQQLLDSLAVKYTYVGVPKLTGQETMGTKTIYHWSVPVVEIVGDVVNRRWVDFYVDELDNAYWANSEPKATPVESSGFAVDLKAYLISKIVNNTIRYGILLDVNPDVERATVEVIMPDNTTKNLLVIRASGVFSYTVII